MRVKNLIDPKAAVGVAIYTLGYGIGFATGAYILNQRWSERYDKDLTEELDKSKAFYRVLLKKDVSPEELFLTNASEDESDDWDVEDVIDAEDEADEEAEEDAYLAEVLNDYRTAQMTDDAVEVVKGVFPKAKVVRIEKDFSDVHQITKDDVRYLSDEVDNTELTFFRQDGVLCHDDGSIIYHPEDVLGMDAFKALDDIPEDDTRIYLFSEAHSHCWLIDMETGAYADTYIQHSVRMHNHTKTPRFRVNDE